MPTHKLLFVLCFFIIIQDKPALLTKRTDLKGQLAWGWFLLSKRQRTQAISIFKLVAHWMQLLVKTQEQHIVLAQLNFWHDELQTLRHGKTPQHPLMQECKNSLGIVAPSASMDLLQTLEAHMWIAQQQELYHERDFNTFTSKLGRYWMILLDDDHEQRTAQDQEDKRRLVLARTKITLAQWWGWDRHHQLSLLPSSWLDNAPILFSAEKDINSIQLLSVTKKPLIERFF